MFVNAFANICVDAIVHCCNTLVAHVFIRTKMYWSTGVYVQALFFLIYVLMHCLWWCKTSVVFVVIRTTIEWHNRASVHAFVSEYKR